MTEVKLCKDCKWSEPEKHSEWSLLCKHPKVNANDPWALSRTEFTGSSCREERSKQFWQVICGMKGRLWDPKH